MCCKRVVPSSLAVLVFYKKVKFDQIRAGGKFIYRQNVSVTTQAKNGLMLLQTLKFDKKTCNS